MENKFTNHLIEIGVIDNKTQNKILSSYKLKYYNYYNYYNYKISENKFNEIMTEILIDFFNNLTEIQKKYICFHLPVKFIKSRKILVQQYLKNIFIKLYLKNKFLLLKYLFRWYKNIHYNKSTLNKIKIKNNYKTNEISNISKYIEEYCLVNNIVHNKNDNKERLNRKEFQKDKKIYFNIDKEKRSRTCNNSKDKNNFFHNLYDKNNNYFRIKNIINKNNKNKKINKIKNLKNINDYTYDNIIHKKPYNITTLNESYYNYIPTNSNTSNIIFYNEDNKEFNTMNSYKMKTNNKIREYKPYMFFDNKMIQEKKYYDKQYQNHFKENIKNNDSITPVTKIYKRNNNYTNNRLLFYSNNNKESNYMKTYYSKVIHSPFCENNKKSPSNNGLDIYNRLFEDGKNRIKRQKRKKLEQDKYLDDLSNQISGEKKNVDYEKINKLYENKERNKTYEKTKLKVEKEEGLTFSPLVNKSKYIKRIYSNFLERNYYNIKYLNEYNNINNYNNNSIIKKKINKKQKDKIINKIINKLNINSLIKNMSNTCNKYTKDNNSSRHKIKI